MLDNSINLRHKRGMNNRVYDLGDFALAKKICEELPKLKQILVDSKSKLTPFMHYKDAANIVGEIDESLLFIDIHIEYYNKIKESRGNIDEK